MSLKLITPLSEILAGELFPSLIITVQNLHDQLDTNYHESINLKIVNSQTKECIHSIVSDTDKGVSTFFNILITTSGFFNCLFSSSDMSFTKKIKVLPSKELLIRNSFRENTLVKNVPTNSKVKLQLEDIYGNKVDSKTQVPVYVKNDNRNTELFGDIIEYHVSIENVKGFKFFIIDGQVSPILFFTLGNTYIFDLREVLQKGFDFKLSSTLDGIHNEGSVFDLGCNYYQDKLYITVMKNTPKNLYYYCQKNMDMGSQIMISQENVSKQYQLTGSNPVFLSNLVVPEKGRIFIYFMSSSKHVKPSSLLLNVVNRPEANKDNYDYKDYQFDYLLQSSVYTEKIAAVNNQKFKPRTRNLVPREAGLTESVSLTYKKNRPQELESIPVNVDNSQGGSVNNEPIFNPQIRSSRKKSSNNPLISTNNTSSRGLNSGTLINMIKENAIQTGPSSFVVNDILSLKDILKQKKVNNQPTSDPLKSNVVRVD